MEDKFSEQDIREGDAIHISYLDDTGVTITGYGVLIQLTDSLIKFSTNQNIIVLPISRLLKLKQRLK